MISRGWWASVKALDHEAASAVAGGFDFGLASATLLLSWGSGDLSLGLDYIPIPNP